MKTINQKEANFEVYSDLFKDVHGYRPRGILHKMFMKRSEAKQSELLRELETRLKKQIDQEEKEVEVFKNKVASVGLDPDKYTHLFY